MENDKLEMNINEHKSKMMVCPFCGEERMCKLRFGLIADKRYRIISVSTVKE